MSDAPNRTEPTGAGPAPADGRTARIDTRPQAAVAFPCDRCGAAMFRMHAVWRCPACGYKTDCCGW